MSWVWPVAGSSSDARGSECLEQWSPASISSDACGSELWDFERYEDLVHDVSCNICNASPEDDDSVSLLDDAFGPTSIEDDALSLLSLSYCEPDLQTMVEERDLRVCELEAWVAKLRGNLECAEERMAAKKAGTSIGVQAMGPELADNARYWALLDRFDKVSADLWAERSKRQELELRVASQHHTSMAGTECMAVVPIANKAPCGIEFTAVHERDEVAFCWNGVRQDQLHRAVYIEVEILSNPDTLCLALTSCNGVLSSSVTFSPDTGIVFFEQACEVLTSTTGMFTIALPALAAGRAFQGFVGLAIETHGITFFRRCGDRAQWESTGLITNLAWAVDPVLMPCLAFRDEGAYHVRAARPSNTPPIEAEQKSAVVAVHWQPFRWDSRECL